MKYQKPAQGILIKSQGEDFRTYEVYCECGNSDHYHAIDVSANDGGEVSVSIYTKSDTAYWVDQFKKRYYFKNELVRKIDWLYKDIVNGTLRRIKWTWQLWVHGKIETESHIIMNQQQAYNYAKTLEQAVKDISEYSAKLDKEIAELDKSEKLDK